MREPAPYGAGSLFLSRVLSERAQRFGFCTPVHRFSQPQIDISIDAKNETNYFHARLNRKPKRFAAQFKEGAKSLTAGCALMFLRLADIHPIEQLEDASPSTRTYRMCKPPSRWAVSFPLGDGKQDNSCSTYLFPWGWSEILHRRFSERSQPNYFYTRSATTCLPRLAHTSKRFFISSSFSPSCR